jgi:hypothetical protein
MEKALRVVLCPDSSAEQICKKNEKSASLPWPFKDTELLAILCTDTVCYRSKLKTRISAFNGCITFICVHH